MASSGLKRDIRARVLGWKLSIKPKSKKEENFISNVFKDLDNLLETVFDKYDDSIRFHECHKIVDLWPITKRVLVKLHDSICRRLRSSPSTASPYFCTITREVSKEVFAICKEIIEHNSFGHTISVTRARFVINITDIRKAIYFFNRINEGEVIIEKENLLKKDFRDESVAKVIVTESKPMNINFNINSEILTLKFHYGFWNESGIPQH